MARTLSITKLAKSFGEKPLLTDVSLDAHAGDIVGIIGKSGCGKSTLLKMLVGFLRPDSGRIVVDEKVITSQKELRRLVGYTTQENSFYEKLTVQENMHYYAGLYNVRDRQRIHELLAAVGLADHGRTTAGDISGGMKRRLDFAIALIHDPPLLILDEPTTGLDPLLVEQFWNIVRSVVHQGKKIAIVTSHILPEIEQHCTKTALLHDGRIIALLTKEKMKGLSSRFTATLEHYDTKNTK